MRVMLLRAIVLKSIGAAGGNGASRRALYCRIDIERDAIRMKMIINDRLAPYICRNRLSIWEDKGFSIIDMCDCLL